MLASIKGRQMNDSSNPVVVPCKGVSSTGRLAGRVAEELERLGADVVTDAAHVSASDKTEVIALDGCASGCSARTLEAAGVSPDLALDLSKRRLGKPGDIHRVAAGVLDRVSDGERTRKPPRRSRSEFAVEPAAMSRRLHTHDDYLLAIDRLSSAAVECGAVPVEAPTIAAHVSLLLDVTPVSVKQMIGQLEADGLVHRSPGKSLVLTDEGRLRADAAMRRQRILECFVTQFLGHTAAESFERAFMIGPSFDSEAVERAFESLGRPERCPHGWPLDAAAARDESAGLMALTAVAEGHKAHVVRIAEDDREAAERFVDAGLELALEVTVITHGDSGEITLDIGSNSATIPAEVAKTIFVRPA